LGDVDAAKSRFAAGATQELQTWAAAQSEDPLGRVCAYCRDWLLRDVLPGYRDLDADPDLEAYFSDRDVVAFVEREDHLRGRGLAPGITAGQAAGPGTLPGSFGGGSGSAFGGLFPDSPFDAGGYGSGSLSSADPQAKEGGGVLLDEEADTDEVGLSWSLPHWKLPDAQWLIAAVAGLGLLLLAGTLVFRPRQGPAPTPERAAGVPARPKPAAAPAAREGSSAQRSLPLRSAAPSEPEIRTLLEAWLKAKSTVMAGEEAPALLEEIARPAPIQRLNSEREQDKARGETQVINVRVKDLSISERSPLRIAVTADLDYSDSRRDATGKERESTAPTTLRNEYVFGRDGDVWRVAASSSAN
ncbi:MAG TPA: ARC6/PARC6 family protein, partial [Cyanobium sp.]|nr:ARC6/PARC6 family protein [Cyanobium sp.]